MDSIAVFDQSSSPTFFHQVEFDFQLPDLLIELRLKCLFICGLPFASCRCSLLLHLSSPHFTIACVCWGERCRQVSEPWHCWAGCATTAVVRQGPPGAWQTPLAAALAAPGASQVTATAAAAVDQAVAAGLLAAAAPPPAVAAAAAPKQEAAGGAAAAPQGRALFLGETAAKAPQVLLHWHRQQQQAPQPPQGMMEPVPVRGGGGGTTVMVWSRRCSAVMLQDSQCV